MPKRILLFILIPLLFTGCTTDQVTQCVYPGNLNIGFGDEFNFSGLKPVYSNNDFTVWISSYISPNNDGIRDTFVIYIEDFAFGTSFISYPYDVIDPIQPSTTNPYDFLYDGSFAIFDNCGDLFFTNNTNSLYWRPGFSDQPEAGVYNVELNLTLTDGMQVSLTEYFEVVYPY